MIKNYSRPQLLIKQVLEQITDAYAPGLNAFIFGPQFDLNRVNNAEEFASYCRKYGLTFERSDRVIIEFDYAEYL